MGTVLVEVTYGVDLYLVVQFTLYNALTEIFNKPVSMDLYRWELSVSVNNTN